MLHHAVIASKLVVNYKFVSEPASPSASPSASNRPISVSPSQEKQKSKQASGKQTSTRGKCQTQNTSAGQTGQTEQHTGVRTLFLKYCITFSGLDTNTRARECKFDLRECKFRVTRAHARVLISRRSTSFIDKLLYTGIHTQYSKK